MSHLVHIGFNNLINADRIAGITSPSSAPAKRAIVDARSQNKLIDMTNGRKTKSVIFEENGYIILSALAPETIRGRVDGTEVDLGNNERSKK
jgi:regulator of extracellular matrix RemA (YlzA/DUF370 family)